MKKLRILNIVGARPQIIKASAISRAIAGEFRNEIEEVVVHTGQHYDRELSDVFFDELEIKRPDHNLQVGSGRHGRQTGMIMERIEDVILDEKPDCVVIYGDTNSTLAAALAAVKQHFPVVHIEAGMRSFNKTMPEEINRIMADHASTLLIAPTNAAFKNLMSEGFRPENVAPYSINNPRVFLTGAAARHDARQLGPEHFDDLPVTAPVAAAAPADGEVRPLRDAVAAAEKAEIVKALAAAQGVKLNAAKLLNISRAQLYEKLAAHGLLSEPPDRKEAV